MPDAPIIRIEKVSKWYGQFQVLTDIDLEVRAGERIVICGPSGSGKSTLIRCINHLEKVQKGSIAVDGHVLTDKAKNAAIAVANTTGGTIAVRRPFDGRAPTRLTMRTIVPPGRWPCRKPTDLAGKPRALRAGRG